MPRRLRVSRLQALNMVAAPGSFTWAGFNAELTKARHLTMEATRGIFQWSGFNINLAKQKFYMQATSGVFAWTGRTAELTYTGSLPTWSATVPNKQFTFGVTETFPLTTYTLGFNPTLHKFEVLSGTLPAGVTLNQSTGLSYNGAGPAGGTGTVSYNIADLPQTPPETQALTGLDWDGTGTARRMLYWLNPPPQVPMTYLFKVYQREQITGAAAGGSRYYTTFFWGNNGNFSWGSGASNSYYGAHPYPEPPPLGNGKWEISVDGNDFGISASVPRDDGTAPYISADGGEKWYSQAFIASTLTASTARMRFYINLPSVTTHNRITHDTTVGRISPPTPAIVFGQAPDFQGLSWGGYARWEEQNAIIRGIQIYTTALAEAQVVALSALEYDTDVRAYCTANGLTSALWYLNMNPTPTDVTDKRTSGTIHNPSWDGSARPTLYTSITADQDWTTRSTAPGVFRVNPFNQTSDLGTNSFNAVMGYLQGSGGNSIPIIDTSIKTSGAGSMRFDIVPQIAGSTNWWTNFSNDYSLQFGAGDTFYFQFAVRYSANVASHYGPKVFLCGTGDTAGSFASSCSDLEIELNTDGTGSSGYFHMYNACPGACGASSIFSFSEPFGGSDFKLQPGIAGCLYSNRAACIKIADNPNTWFTFQVGVTLGALQTIDGHDWFYESNVKTWVQIGVGPEQLMYNWTGGISAGNTHTSSPPNHGLCAGQTPGSGQKYGKLWLMPYNQFLASGASAGSVWYDALILSTQRIPPRLA